MAQKYLLAWETVQTIKGKHRLQRICTRRTHICFKNSKCKFMHKKTGKIYIQLLTDIKY